MQDTKKAYLQLHASVFLWGFTAILGKLITIREVPLVWYRMLFTCVIMLFLPMLWKGLRNTPRRNIYSLAGIGCIVCLHWVCFYGSIKMTNVSVALCCLSTTSFFTSILDPIFTRTKIKYIELLLGIVIIPAIYLIFHFTNFEAIGIIVGLLSAFFAAAFTVMNKKMVEVQEPVSMTFIELGSGFVFLSLVMPLYFYFYPAVSMLPSTYDWSYLIILAGLCTVLPFIMALKALKQISAFASVLTVNLEPVYGILLAIPFFHENKDLHPGFYLGTIVILLVVFLHPFLQKRLIKAFPIIE